MAASASKGACFATVVGASRNRETDIIKGGAILLVVLGHALQVHLTDFDRNLLFRIIYSFHMPLFMILSGWYARPERTLEVRKRAARLLPPVFVWYFLLYLVTDYNAMSLREAAVRWVKSPDVGLWFLWVAFLCHLWLIALNRCLRQLGALRYAVGSLVLYAIPFSILGLKLVKYYFPFFILGYAASRNWKQMVRYSKLATYAAVVTFPIALQYWHRTSVGIAPVNVRIGGNYFDIAIPLLMASRVACALAGSTAFAHVMVVLGKTRIGPVFAWFGLQTLEIYAVHQNVIPIAIGQGSIAVITSVLAATSLSVAAVWILSKNRWASLVLLGRISRRRET